jgi:Alkaline and neutral invertase
MKLMDAADAVKVARDLLFKQAMVSIGGEWGGSVAAIPTGTTDPTLNYSEIFIRDNVPVMAYMLLMGEFSTVKNFLTTCLQLQSTQFQTKGIFPTSFVEHDHKLVPDYGQRAIGRVVSIDATLWWPILAWSYVKRSGDYEFARSAAVQNGLNSFLELVLHPGFRDAPTLYVPDGAFMIDRPMDVWGAPLEIQSLLYGALLSAAGLLQIDLKERQGRSIASSSQSERLKTCLAWIKRLRRYMLVHYWVTSKTVQVLRRRPTEQYGELIENEYNIQTETIPHWLQDWLRNQGGYLIGNIRTGRPDFRFFTLGNCLGSVFDLISTPQQLSLFRLISSNRDDLVAQMPLRICHPPLEDVDWRKKTGFDRKNLPWCYHNAGHWPCLLWFMALAVLRHPQQNHLVVQESRDLLQHAYHLLLTQLPRQQWAEYFDGPTGTWQGQQARVNQTWTIVGFLLVHHLLHENPADANILDVPHLQDFRPTIANE